MGSHTVGRFDEAGVFTWTHSDHLGSASAATNAAGVAAWRESYTPFGEILDDFAANRDQPGFTGHIRDAATGLTYAQARYYNPVTARFLAPDPVGFADASPGGDPRYFNRYSYVYNDPINGTDPTGECGPFTHVCVGAGLGAIIGGASAAVREVMEQRTSGEGINLVEIGVNFAIGAGTGAIQGAVIAGTGNIGLASASGSLVGAAQGGLEAASDAAFGDDISTGNVLGSMVGGAIGGAIGPAVAPAVTLGRPAAAGLGAVTDDVGIGVISAAAEGVISNSVAEEAAENIDNCGGPKPC